MLLLKGPCVSLPAGASPGLPSSRQPKHTQPHPHPTQEAAGRPPCRGHASALLQMGMASVAVCWGFKCFGKLLRGGPTPWGSPGKPPSCCIPSLHTGVPRKPLLVSHPSLVIGEVPYPLPTRASLPGPPSRAGPHMRLLGGILRPSRNQVTCGRGKLAMRGARMTAASPWETLWCFSPSSKLPMSAGGKRGCGGQTAQLLGWTWRGQDDRGEGSRRAQTTHLTPSPHPRSPSLGNIPL